ncbi:hypothetical protein [Victivallis sp. Marseille-Q1083]|uniref:hypothetical protein n=1 Tax=Victivallis sp. Marseille-Q1083 TaxID=2717288 RepID=UPI001589DE92|nr:hypothetical protein [Victivallis sp. Marseille-Q1083]
MFKALLRDIVSPRHAMEKLADAIDWQSFEDGLEASFCVENGRPSCPVRLMVALHYLKYASGQSTMSRRRKRLAKSGAEKLLEESLKTGLCEGFIKKSELTRVNVDSTVQEKVVRYPTDARLYDRLRERLVKSAQKNGIELRQTYERIGKKFYAVTAVTRKQISSSEPEKRRNN